MKKRVSYSLLLLITLMALSCTEEISEEIQNSSSSSSSSDSDVDFTTKSIRLVHTMDEGLSYVMHKAGNYESDCELQAPSAGFDADDYDYTDNNYAIDCVLDAEELDLASKGVKFELQVDDQLCEYISYKPYSALRFKPGRTSRIVYKVECDSACAENATVGPLCDNTYDEFYGTGGAIGTQVGNLIPETENLCFYDYDEKLGSDSDSFDYPNCDEGSYTTYTVSFTESGDPATCTGVVYSGESTKTDCGGNYRACLDGALKNDEDINYLEGSTTIVHNEDLSAYTREWVYEPYIESDQYAGSSVYANYSRICANTDDIKTNDSVISSTITLLGWQSEDIRKYDANIYDGSLPVALQGLYGFYNYSITENSPGGPNDGLVEATDYADNMFRGAVHTQPYYSFGCYDKARDIKAQIRLFIRDWDRKFTNTNITMNANSDVYLEEDALMDTRDEEQPGGGGLDSLWNDYDDLDDFFEDNNVWDQNECVESSNPWSDDNFPGKSNF